MNKKKGKMFKMNNSLLFLNSLTLLILQIDFNNGQGKYTANVYVFQKKGIYAYIISLHYIHN